MSALSMEQLQRELRTLQYGLSCEYLSATGSTNDDARRAIEAGAATGHVIVADAQHNGRGSRGRSWASPAGSDLYLSIIDRPAVALPELPPLTLAVGLAVAEAAQALIGHASIQVKWPNDVLVDGRKCAGVLIEANAMQERVDAVVIGIGLNVNRTDFPDELREYATSLRLSDPEQRALDRTVALARLLESVERWVQRFVREGAASIVTALAPRLAFRGERVRCDDVLGILRGVEPSGALSLETARGLCAVSAGRIELAG
jgi:BirA family biotin operon repressor/biotin-[acetyl-CoA-carboxylase] ligase